MGQRLAAWTAGLTPPPGMPKAPNQFLPALPPFGTLPTNLKQAQTDFTATTVNQFATLSDTPPVAQKSAEDIIL